MRVGRRPQVRFAAAPPVKLGWEFLAVEREAAGGIGTAEQAPCRPGTAETLCPGTRSRDAHGRGEPWNCLLNCTRDLRDALQFELQIALQISLHESPFALHRSHCVCKQCN